MTDVLRDKVAIVTGAARGHSEAVARRFAEEGATVAICDVVPVEVLEDQVGSKIREAGGQVLCSQTDVSNEDQVNAMVEETLDLVERFDPDQVQFCAVTAYPGTPLYEMLSGTRDFDYATMTGFQALEGNEYMTAAEIEGWIRRAYRRFYLRPRWLWRRMRDVSGPREFIAQAREGFALLSRNA